MRALQGDETLMVDQGNRVLLDIQVKTLLYSHTKTVIGLQGQYLYVDTATINVVAEVNYFPPGDQLAGIETQAFLRAASEWKP
jgi:hypothetical protein